MILRGKEIDRERQLGRITIEPFTPEQVNPNSYNFRLGGTMEAMGSAHYAATLYASRSVSTLGVWIQFSAPLGHSGAVFP